MAQERFPPFTLAAVICRSRGTVLDLPLASAIVEAWGRRMGVESGGVGQETTFNDAFPAVPQGIAGITRSPQPGSGLSRGSCGN